MHLNIFIININLYFDYYLFIYMAGFFMVQKRIFSIAGSLHDKRVYNCISLFIEIRFAMKIIIMSTATNMSIQQKHLLTLTFVLLSWQKCNSLSLPLGNEPGQNLFCSISASAPSLHLQRYLRNVLNKAPDDIRTLHSCNIFSRHMNHRVFRLDQFSTKDLIMGSCVLNCIIRLARSE